MNFGEDCDCTGASVGAILGILNPAGIGEKWLAPIGRSLVLSREITGIDAPRTLDEFSELICSLRGRVGLERNPARSFEPRPVPGALHPAPLREAGGSIGAGRFRRPVLPVAGSAGKRA